MDLQPIRDLLRTNNPWWASERVPGWSAPPFRRREIADLMNSLERERVTVLAGLRRSGKTTLVHQAIEELISRGVEPRRIVYARVDDMTLLGYGPMVFLGILDVLSETSGKPPSDGAYAFFDEVQTVPDWGLALKNIWDRKSGVKMTATGSAGLIIRGAVGESLAGRAETMELGPMGLRDWAGLSSVRVRDASLDAIVASDDPAKGMGDWISMGSARSALAPILRRYLLIGGLPESVPASDEVPYFEHLLDDVVERVVFRDIPALYGLRQPRKLAKVLVLLADKTGFPTSVDGLAKALPARHETVEDYITFLLASRVIIELQPFTGSEFSRARSASKHYLADTGLQNAIMHREMGTLADETIMGKLAEQAVAIHLCKLATRRWERIYYAPVHKGSEVDFVLQTRNGPLPIECKYRSAVRDKEVAALDRYREGIGARHAVMVTREELGRRGECVLVPLWMFLIAE